MGKEVMLPYAGTTRIRFKGYFSAPATGLGLSVGGTPASWPMIESNDGGCQMQPKQWADTGIYARLIGNGQVVLRGTFLR